MRALADDPDAAMALVADLVAATDPALRAAARALAGRVVIDVARRGRPRRGGIGHMITAPLRLDGGDVDLDASLDAFAEVQPGHAVDADQLRIRRWTRPLTAWCAVVDRSGSMGGEPLAANAVVAAAMADRRPDAYSVLAFNRTVVAVKAQDEERDPHDVVTRVLSLRGQGTTDVAAALRAAAVQLRRSAAGRRVAVLLSDCRSNEPGDLAGAAGELDELVIVAPSEDPRAAAELAAVTNARWMTADTPTQVAAAIRQLLD